MSRVVLDVSGLGVALPHGSDRAHAVRDISFSVNAGEIVCLLGESGSGKSIIAQTVMGLLPAHVRATEGQALLLGEDVLKYTPEQLRAVRGVRMSMIFQEPMTALNPVMACGEQVDEMLTQHTALPAEERRRKILDIFAQVKLPEPERIYASYPHQLSGGQRQRIMIAMALMLEPALLIADEPTTALDVTTQAEILRLIRQLQREHNTGVLFITHDMGVVAEIADRVVVLQLGKLVEQGTKLEVLQSPREAYTRMLLDAVPSLEPPELAHQPEAPAVAPVLLVRDLQKTYVSRNWFGRKREVDAAIGVNLTVERGETVGIVGESGSGKSTVARCIVRLIEPTAGHIEVLGQHMHGRSIASLKPLRKKVQIVFQDPYRSLNPRQTVGAAIIEGPMNFGASRTAAWQRAEALMELVRLAPSALNRYPSEFSGGQRQRICIARTLAMDPELLICDEAVSALDVSVAAQILELLAEIQQRLHLALLFITHDLRVAAQICDRVIVMEKGRIVEQGRTRDVFTHPQQPYTRALLAAAPGREFAFGHKHAALAPA
ncbi:MAG: ABC transporter ATP-binding protein [Betaproteobacteria bacterium]|nr:ABC transporter ATP-binding protein [Betaproteobacteria bacterium]